MLRRLGRASALCAPTGCANMRVSARRVGAKVSPQIAQAIQGSEGEAMVDPMIYHVPTVCARPLGRDRDVLQLWKYALQGHKVLAITGVDGIGKSTVAAEFCDCARRSKRFSCIHWFPHTADLASLKEQLAVFMGAMRGRVETDVLLVLDDVADAQAVASLLPAHSNLFTVITTPDTNVRTTKALHTLQLGPLPGEAMALMVSALHGDAASRMELYTALGSVPLLTTVAGALLDSGASTAEALHEAINTVQQQRADGCISIRQNLEVLVSLGCEHVAKQAGTDAVAILRCVLCFHDDAISPHVIESACRAYRGDAVGADDSDTLVTLYRELGFLSEKWEGEGMTCHPLTASVVRAGGDASALEHAATVLLGMFPRRWRGMGSDAAMNLVRHTKAVVDAFAERQHPVTPALVSCCDRAAAICAYHEGRELNLAVFFWQEMRRFLAKQGPSAERYRVSHEAGKVMHHLRHPDAKIVLEDAYKAACDVFGALSTESALVLATLGLYMGDTFATCELLRDAESAIRARTMTTDDVVGDEEAKMLQQTLAVLLMRRVQIAEALGSHTHPATAGAWDALQTLKAQMQQSPDTKNNRAR